MKYIKQYQCAKLSDLDQDKEKEKKKVLKSSIKSKTILTIFFSIIFFNSTISTANASGIKKDNNDLTNIKQSEISKENKNSSFLLKKNIVKQSTSSTENKLYSSNPLINEFLKAPYNLPNMNLLPMPKETDLKKLHLNSKKQIALSKVISEKYGLSEAKALHVVKTAYKVSSQNNIDPVLLLSITAVESRFNEKARNPSGAVGLVQAVPRAHPEKIRAIKKRGGDVYNISDNLNLGAEILSECFDRANGNQTLALQRYNGSLGDKRTRYAKKVYQAMTPLKNSIAYMD